MSLIFRGGMRQSQGAIHVEGAGGVNAHQLTGDATDDDDHHHDIVGADDETKMQANRNLKIQFPGSVFSHWKVARWAQKLRLENRFELKDGKLTVTSPGIYYLYAQVRLQPELQTFGLIFLLPRDP